MKFIKIITSHDISEINNTSFASAIIIAPKDIAIIKIEYKTTAGEQDNLKSLRFYSDFAQKVVETLGFPSFPTVFQTVFTLFLEVYQVFQLF